jgi:NAD-dependent dihydropyrimidine dehydrogenase PreA subunit
MSHHHRIGRRQFIVTSAGVVATTISCGRKASAEQVEAAAKQVGPIPRRKFANSGREVSVLIGSATWSAAAVEAGLLCGINYWHKADEWNKQTLPRSILQSRDAHYCEVCCDRVRGNHETGAIDEQAHVHFGYHNAAEVKNNRSFIRAYDRLKKKGLVRHLCLSQHSYQGNWKVRDGEPAYEILTAVLNDGVYEHAQFAFTFADNPGINEFVSQASRKGFGTTAMKTTGGASRMKNDREFMKRFPEGTSPHQALARWLTTATPLSAAVIQIKNLDQFVDTYSGAGKPQRAADSRAIEQMSEYADREVCRLCNDCMPRCEKGLAIADILRYERYARDYHERELAQLLYAQLEVQAGSCSACGACLPHCPQGLSIPERLAQAHKILS